jgi:acyl-coenzyme A synthetase/AMP-(fatty) acid ligase
MLGIESDSWRLRDASERYNLFGDLIVRHLRNGRGDAPALHFESETLSYKILFDRVGIARAILKSEGVGRSDRVGIVLHDSPAYVCIFLAAISLGAVPVGIDRNQNSVDLLGMLQQVGARCVFVGQPDEEHAVAIETSSLDIHAVRVDLLLTSMLHDVSEADPLEDHEVCTAGDVLYITFSSGTTGRPKAVIRRHGDILYCAKSVSDGLFAVNSTDVVLPVTKLTFGYSLVGGLMFTLLAGGSLIVSPDRMSADKLAALAQRHRATILLAQPRILAELSGFIESSGPDWLASIKVVTSAGDVLSTAVRERWTALSGLPVVDGFGSVEVGHIFVGDNGGNLPDGALGRAMPGYELRLVDADGNEVAEGETGRLAIAGASITSGYWNDPRRTREAFVDGWHISDDLFVRSGEIYYYAGRWDDLIKTGCGEWISPVRIENVLRRDTRIADCAVTAMLDSANVTRVKAVVVPLDGSDHSGLVRDLHNRVEQEWPLLDHMRVHHVEFAATIPRSANGKIMRSNLK